MTKRKTTVHYNCGRSEVYIAEDWSGPQDNAYMRGFVEVGDGFFLNALDIKWIEVEVEDE